MKKCKHFFEKFIIMLILLCAFCNIAYADETFSVTVLYDVSGAEMKLYYAGSVDEQGNPVLSDVFSKYDVSIENPDCAYTLYLYALRDSVPVTASAVTDENKACQFSNLEKGIYLIAGEDFVRDNKKYSIVPSLVYVYENMTVYCKCAEEELTESKTLTVTKVWEDKDYEEMRPGSVEIQLLKDGKLADEVILNKENQWQHKWEGLDSRYSWVAVEKRVPNGYEVSISLNENHYAIVNTYTDMNKKLPPTITDSMDKKLPQTGQSWLPVPILIIFGLVLMISGGLLCKTGKAYEK